MPREPVAGCFWQVNGYRARSVCMGVSTVHVRGGLREHTLWRQRAARPSTNDFVRRDRLAAPDALEVGEHALHGGFEVVGGKGRDVRREHEVVQADQG